MPAQASTTVIKGARTCGLPATFQLCNPCGLRRGGVPRSGNKRRLSVPPPLCIINRSVAVDQAKVELRCALLVAIWGARPVVPPH
jgi:hypothetical protein